MTTAHSLAPYLEWAKTRPAAKLDLAGSNILPCSISDLPGAAGALALDGRNDEGYAPLIDSIANRYGVESGQVTTAQGASGANFLVCAALLEPGDEALVETPGYDPLFAAPRLLGAQVAHFTREVADKFSVDPDRVRRAMTPRTRLIVVTSPHNPSGVVAGRQALEEIGRIAQSAGAHVLLDEVYVDAAETQRLAALSDGPFIRTNSLTKSYGLSGLRSGWIISSREIAHRIRRARDVVDGTGSIVAERLAVLAFQHLERLRKRASEILDANRPIIRAFLSSRHDLEWNPSAGTTVFPRLRGVGDTSAFAERLLCERGTAVVPGQFFQAPQHIRIGFAGATDTLRAGLDAIAAALDAKAWI